MRVGLDDFNTIPAAELPTKMLIVPIADFVAIEEPGANAILGGPEAALIPEGGDTMFYGDGGVGKTTLALDLAFHLAAGDNWLSIPVARAARVLVLENEGPRALFRRKLARKLAGWTGSPLGDRIHVYEHPWAQFSFAEQVWRQMLAAEIRAQKIDVLIAGPVTSSGMDAAGTLQEVREFAKLVAEVRVLSGRQVAIVLVHHEAKGGKVSGAWESVGDTLFHVQQQGHARVRLYVQKARWASEQHATTLQLEWSAGDSFRLADDGATRPERVWNDVAAYVLEHGGCAWNEVDQAVSGQGEYKRRRRDVMLEAGEILNLGRGQTFELWHRDDPDRPTLDTTASSPGRGSDAGASTTGDEGETATASPRPLRSRDAVGDAVGSVSPGALEPDLLGRDGLAVNRPQQ